MEAMRQALIATYIAVGEVLGDAGLRKMNSVLRDAIADGAVDHPTAITVLESLLKAGELDLDEDAMPMMPWPAAGQHWHTMFCQ